MYNILFKLIDAASLMFLYVQCVTKWAGSADINKFCLVSRPDGDTISDHTESLQFGSVRIWIGNIVITSYAWECGTAYDLNFWMRP